MQELRDVFILQSGLNIYTVILSKDNFFSFTGSSYKSTAATSIVSSYEKLCVYGLIAYHILKRCDPPH